jgi:hypothetical protein
MRQTFFLRAGAPGLLVGTAVILAGCHTGDSAECRAIQRDAETEEASADQRLDEALRACNSDPECQARVMDEYAAEMRAIQARRDARVDALLDRARR